MSAAINKKPKYIPAPRPLQLSNVYDPVLITRMGDKLMFSNPFTCPHINELHPDCERICNRNEFLEWVAEPITFDELCARLGFPPCTKY